MPMSLKLRHDLNRGIWNIHSPLFAAGVGDDFLAAGDEVGECLAFEQTVGKKGEVDHLLEDVVRGAYSSTTA